MIDYEKIFALAKECGFTEVGKLDASTLEFRSEVRDMCAENKCRAYNTNWCCPPACGTIEEAAERASAYREGIIVQTVGHMEDEFDVEVMLGTNEVHKENIYRIIPQLRELYPDILPMAAGGCTLCEKCTYPDAPCRHPDLVSPSMEAYGLVVSDVCEKNGMKYYYGKLTITYTSTPALLIASRNFLILVKLAIMFFVF